MKIHTLVIAAAPMKAIKIVSVVLLLAATGCTTLYEGKYDFSEGWREAQVIRVAKASQIETPQFSDCRQKFPLQQDANTQFVLLSYKHLGRSRNRVVQSPQDLDLQTDEFVYMNVKTCAGSIVKRQK